MRIFIILFLLLYSLVGVQSTILAQDTPLEVHPVYPENQKEEVKGYFHLSVNPGEQQTVKVKLVNKTVESVNVRIEPSNGYTNPEGGMLYEKELNTEDASLLEGALEAKNFFKVKDSIILEPQQTLELPIEIAVPDKGSGTFLGAVKFIVEGNKDEKQTAKKGEANFILKTEIAHAMAIQLDVGESPPPKFSLGKAGFNQIIGKVYLTMINEAQRIQEGVEGTYFLENEQGDRVSEGGFGPFKMAPTTEIRYPFNLGTEPLTEGTYRLAVTMDVNGKVIKNEQNITLEKEAVKEFAERAPGATAEIQEEGMPSWTWALIGGVGAVVLIFIMGLLRKLKK
ncbi:WxL protein peptidoglycan domain-containing protein [Ureibacillus sp. GCM10028918]|uniref:WxL protein peptidoglycan domain-containing protein n=1 Tax=Ureibacillus sp. GCM10028918 TaxID=3273429 RepID=UPI003623E3A9